MDPPTQAEREEIHRVVSAEVDHLCSGMMAEQHRANVKGFVFNMLHIFDNFMRVVGVAFVLLAIVLISAVVIAWYKLLAPYLMMVSSTPMFAAHAVYAHWLLINIAFNYTMVVWTSPGYIKINKVSPADHEALMRSRSPYYCKKCMSRRPARAHHCSICGRCVLKMDHHCPWINRCVGHFNHRYFFLFMAYLWMGCIYIISVTGHPFLLRRRVYTKHSTASAEEKSEAYHLYKAGGVIFSFILTVAVAIALGVLLGWHVWLVSKGLTTIEFHETGVQKRAAALRHERWAGHPYDRGLVANWKSFLGLTQRRTVLSVLLPSTHDPAGDGYDWSHVTFKTMEGVNVV